MNEKLQLLAASSVVLCSIGCSPEPAPEDPAAATTGIRFLAEGESDGFARAYEPIDFEFPRDHGPHPEFMTEWWYFTGNLTGDGERHFGFELTFFRFALAPGQPARESRWASRQIWMAHFALTDTDNARFHTEELVTRDALGLAGAGTDAFDVRVRDWTASQQDPDAPIRLVARSDEAGIELELEPQKPIVLNGVRGLDQKGPEPGNASYYYSIPRLEVGGRVTLGGGEPIPVSGLAWLDREWGTSALSNGIEGWDWFALQLSDGRDLMYYRLRTSAGTASPQSGGTVIDPNGDYRHLGPDAARLVATDWWTSDPSGVRYPIAWRLAIPDEALSLEIAPTIPNQELNLSVRYWEGAVEVAGTSAGAPVGGHGYLELAGYTRAD